MSVLGISPHGPSCSSLHGSERTWRESNCYVDVWIEILKSISVDELACFGHAVAEDFEQDQWTFFKPPHYDLQRLYGLEIEELAIWRSVLEHCVTQVEHGRLPLVEVDSFYLPDTELSDYRRNHVKTTIAVDWVSRDGQKLRYLHNSGYHELEADDFEGLFRVGGTAPGILPPYCEVVKLDRVVHRDADEIRGVARELLARHVARIPSRNPFEAFERSIAAWIDSLISDGGKSYDGYVFTNLRQCGAAFDYAAEHLIWLDDSRESLIRAADEFRVISRTAKMLIMKIARMVQRGAAQDVTEHTSAMSRSWQHAVRMLRDECSG